MTTVTLEAGGESVTLFHVGEADWPVCIIGLELLQAAVKRAKKALIAIALDPQLCARREAECGHLLDLFRSENPMGKLGIPLPQLDTLRAGLALEFDATEALQGSQEELRLDPEDTERRIKQLDRLMSELDVQGMQG